jgi:hypothetical protein
VGWGAPPPINIIALALIWYTLPTIAAAWSEVRLPSKLEVAIDIASIAGLFISVAGLWYSVKAWRGAIAAEKAAKEAREAVRRSNAADELLLLAGVAKELLACVQNEQSQAAAVRGRDLV